jgi:hypothetical protein
MQNGRIIVTFSGTIEVFFYGSFIQPERIKQVQHAS